MKKSVTSFIAVMLIVIFLGVTAVTGVYIPGGWTMPFRNTATSDTSATDTSDTSSTDSSADKADNKADSTDASADTSADSASTDSADTTDSGLKAIIPSVLDTDNGIRLGLDHGRRLPYRIRGRNPGRLRHQQPVRRHELGTEGHSSASDRQGLYRGYCIPQRREPRNG